ncbi:MAG: hypothetical protein KDD66_03740 [Bdellovibrionales bacterium]|nr:hypothetical protein [Bdellovibrionales bacterium]
MTDNAVFAWVWAASAWFLVFLLPGWLLHFALRPTDRQPGVGTSLVTSMSMLIPIGLVCSRLGLLPFALPLGLCAAVIVLVRNRTRKQPMPVAPDLLEAFALLTACGLASALHYGEIFVSPAVRGGFFYLSEIKYFLQHAGLPNTVYHFGSQIVPQVDKFGFDILGALYWQTGPNDPLVLKKVGYLLTLIVGCACAYEFFRKFVGPALSAAAALMIYGNVWLGSAVTLRAFFIPEAIAFVVLLAAFAFALDSVSTENERRSSLFTALALAVCACFHLEIAFIAGSFVASLYIAEGIRSRNSSPFLQLLKTGILSLSLLMLCYFLLGTAPGFLGSSTPTHNDVDLTWSYFPASDLNLRGVSVPGVLSIHELLHQVFWENGLLLRNPTGAAVILFLFAAASMFAWTILAKSETGECKSIVVAAAASLQVGLLLLISILCNSYFDTWIYRTEALRRLIPYLSVFILINLIAVSEFIFSSTSRSYVKKAPTILFGVLAILFHTASYPYMFPVNSPYTVSPAAAAALKWISKNTPGETVVLSNIASNGAFHVLADRKALTEGHQPMLRSALVAETINRLQDAEEFFAHPDSNYLKSNHVSLVVISRGSADFGGTMFAKGFEESEKPDFMCRAWKAGHIEIYRYCELEDETSHE